MHGPKVTSRRFAPTTRVSTQAQKPGVRARMRANEWNWLQAARRALEANRSTFAILPMSQLFDPDGYVAKLRAEGYDVVEP